MNSAIVMLSAVIPTLLLGLSPLSAGEISTTRLKSTAGTGVATMLVDEATVLNPSSISFFQMSSFYLQKAGADVTPNQESSPLAPSNQDELLFIASDAKGTVDGSISYAKSKDKHGKMSRLAGSMSAPIGEKSALGLSYAQTDRDGGPLKGKMKQISAGVTHAINREFTFGLVVPDLLGEDELQRRAIAGAQFVYKDFVSVMIDAGVDWEREFKESSLARAALQLKVFTDFYMRIGASEDRGLKRKSTGAGIGWVQPRLMIDVAMARTEYSEIASIGQDNETAKETSFSLAYHF